MGVLVQDGRMLREGIVESAATCLFYRRTNGDRDGVFTNTYLQYLHPSLATSTAAFPEAHDIDRPVDPPHSV